MYFQHICILRDVLFKQNQWLIRLHEMNKQLFSSEILETFKKKHSVIKISTKPMTISLFPKDVAFSIFGKNDQHHFQRYHILYVVLILTMLCVSLLLPSFKPKVFYSQTWRRIIMLILARKKNYVFTSENTDKLFMSLLQKRIHLKSCHHETNQ